MKKIISITLFFLTSCIVSYTIFNSSIIGNATQPQFAQKFSAGTEDDPNARLEYEFMMLRDPVTNQIPPNIFQMEQEFAKNLPKRVSNNLNKPGEQAGINALTWTARGPNNVGGRTRALGIDIRTTPPNVTIIAGGVSGGIWRSSNDGSSWNLVTLPSQLHNTTCIAQDRRSGFQDVWYIGSGEGTGNSASGGGAYFLGDGIFKSTDNGGSWLQLASTINNSPQSFNSDFEIVWNIATDQSNTTEDELYAACLGSIQRSTNGGTSWTRVRGAYAGSYYTDVQVTTTGVVYATLSTDYLSGSSINPGIWRSTDGISWTNITPTGFPSTYYRIVIAISPSNENIVYFLGETSGGTTTLGHSIWQYNSTTTSWSNRSANIPAIGGSVGNFNSQGSYDLVLKIKPDDPNFVLIGGTNLYRSTSGFTNTTATTWIGGYSPANNVTQYPNHHPDQHAIAFLPGSNIITYTGHDGGISKTTNITTSLGGNVPVVWTSLNNSYHTTQFYSISLAPESGSNAMMGGLQDNSTFFGNAPGSSNWTDYESGDGTMVEVAPIADDRVYTAYQNGGVRRRTRAGAWPTGFPTDDFTPSGTTNKLFVNPQVLDPNNSTLFYYGAGNTPTNTNIWRCNPITATSSTGWTRLTSTTTTTATTSAIGVSISNSANVVYFGTTGGIIRKITDANSGSTPTTTLDLGASVPNGYVSCIAVDPTNSEKALVVLSNYNIQSLWYTNNGGTSWTDVEGNLAGASGPSIRWASVFYVSGVPHYFIATSVGVYYTILLNGGSTVWTQDAVSEIGNVVCTMLDWRNSDGTLAVATHGRGIFTTQITSPLPVELSSFTAKILRSGGIQLNWQTKTEINNYGFNIERAEIKSGYKTDDLKFIKISFAKGYGNSNSPKDYSFEDKKALYGNYAYRLKQIDNDGKYVYSSIVEIDLGNPINYSLEQNYPNPFNPNTSISFSLPEKSNVTLSIYNSLGELVEVLANSEFEAGRHTFNWNAANLSSGIYFYTIQTKKINLTRKMILIK